MKKHALLNTQITSWIAPALMVMVCLASPHWALAAEAPAAQTQTATDSPVLSAKKQKIAEIIELSGLRESREKIVTGIKSYTSEPLAVKDPNQVIFNPVFNVDDYILLLIDQADAQLTQTQVDQLLKWYRSDLGRKISTLESEHDDADEAATKESPNSNAKYLQQIERLCVAVRIKDILERMITANYYLGAVVGVISQNGKLTDEQRAKAEQYIQAAKPTFITKELVDSTLQDTKESLIKMYASLNYADMEKYLFVLESSAFQKFDKADAFTAWLLDRTKAYEVAINAKQQ